MGCGAPQPSPWCLWQHTHHSGGDRRLGEDIHGQGKHLLEPETQGAGERNTPQGWEVATVWEEGEPCIPELPWPCWASGSEGTAGTGAQLWAGQFFLGAGNVFISPTGAYLGGQAWGCRVSRASRYREASQDTPWAASAMGTC